MNIQEKEQFRLQSEKKILLWVKDQIDGIGIIDQKSLQGGLFMAVINGTLGGIETALKPIKKKAPRKPVLTPPQRKSPQPPEQTSEQQ